MLRVLTGVLLALVAGLGSAYLAVMYGNSSRSVANGPWVANLDAGARGADIYTRAYVALTSLFALSRDEAIYYNTAVDSSGAALDGACLYRLAGSDPDARWWSVTAYGLDHFLIDTPSRRHSVDKTNVERAADGSFVISVSAAEQPGNWIATRAEGFELSLRLYNAGPSVHADPATTPLPSIAKVGCP